SEGMPSRRTVVRWAVDLPAFDQRFRQARLAGARPVSGKAPGYTPEIADAIVVRVAEGERIDDILRDPDMPCRATLYTWMARHPAFAEALARAREAEVDRLADESWIIARSARPETARLAAVQLAHLRWLARVRAPRVYHQRPVEPPRSAEPPLDVVMVRWETEVDSVTGMVRGVSFAANPQTGGVEVRARGEWHKPAHPIGHWLSPDHAAQNAPLIRNFASECEVEHGSVAPPEPGERRSRGWV
ncbi:MAG: hypothetical protein ACK53I_17745, partial [Phenylobacterium sp.]